MVYIKKLLLAALVGGLCFLGCKKEETPPRPEEEYYIKAVINGKPFYSSSKKPDNNPMLTVNDNGEYYLYGADSAIFLRFTEPFEGVKMLYGSTLSIHYKLFKPGRFVLSSKVNQDLLPYASYSYTNQDIDPFFPKMYRTRDSSGYIDGKRENGVFYGEFEFDAYRSRDTLRVKNGEFKVKVRE